MQNGDPGVEGSSVLGTGDEEVTSAEVALGTSPLEEMRRRREKRLEDETLYLSIPTWQGELKARYKVIPRTELNKVLKASRDKDSQEASKGDMDFLSRACQGLYADPAEDPAETNADLTQVGTGYNVDFSASLGKPELDTARKLIFHLFGKNGIAIATHAMKVANWMKDTSLQVDDDADPLD